MFFSMRVLPKDQIYTGEAVEQLLKLHFLPGKLWDKSQDLKTLWGRLRDNSQSSIIWFFSVWDKSHNLFYCRGGFGSTPSKMEQSSND